MRHRGRASVGDPPGVPRRMPPVTVASPDEQAASSLLAAIVESSADAMIGKTLEGVITSWNSGAERMYGYAADEIVGRNISALIPGDRLDELPVMLRRVAGGERVEHYETERIRKNGTVFSVSVSISPILDRTGLIVGASTVARDITDRKRTDADLRDLEERLHQSQRLETVGQLAGGIAHDFNNLLAGIMNYSALVSGGLLELSGRLGLGADETMVSLRQDVAEITDVATRAARLTQQLLIFSRRESIAPVILDLNAVVADVQQLLRRTIGETIRLETELARHLPCIEGDRGQIEQILMNLAVNARDAMTGGGTLRITTSRYEARGHGADRFRVSRGQYVRLSVSDTGRGMSPEVAARAFEPFFTTKAKGEGTGLGLATVYGIVTQAGGDVVISSQLELGARVDVVLPVTLKVAVPLAEVQIGGPAAPLGTTILLVEDEDVVREPTRRMLVNSGYTVLSASSTEEALRIFDEHGDGIELLLTDVVMPGRSGVELAADVNRMSPHTKVLYMSGHASGDVGRAARSQQGRNLIEKPFALNDLLGRVHATLTEG